MQAMVLDHLREHGPATVPEISEATGLPRSLVRMQLALAPDAVVFDGDRATLPLPAPVPCSMRASGQHPAFMRAPGGALVCSACKQVQQ